jgi:hypothetical protein
MSMLGRPAEAEGETPEAPEEISYVVQAARAAIEQEFR